jgi:hypothetical protein
VLSGSAAREKGIEVMKSGTSHYATKHELARLLSSIERQMAETAAHRKGTRHMEQRWIPPNSSTVFHRDGARTAVVYVYPTHSGIGAVAYRGEALRPSWHKIFTSEDLLDVEVGSFFDGIDSPTNGTGEH